MPFTNAMNVRAVAIAVVPLLVACGGVRGIPVGPIPSVAPQQDARMLLYPAHPPSLLPGAQTGSAAEAVTFTNSPAPGVLTPLPGAAQYLVYEANYTGAYSVVNSCDPPAVATASFETELTPQAGGGYSFKPGPVGTGPGAVLDVKSSGILGPQTCTLTVQDALGHAVTIAVTNKQLLIYPDGGTAFGPGAGGTEFFLDATFVPRTFYVYEQGYTGPYVLAPSSCSTFKATLNAPVDPGSPALLSLTANGTPTAEGCTFTVSDSLGNQAFAEAYYEGVP